MNRSAFKAEVSSAIKAIAQKHGVEVKVAPVSKVQDHMESILMITDKSNSRFEQVKALYSKGVQSAKVIADRIGSHPTYIGLLLNKVKQSQLAA